MRHVCGIDETLELSIHAHQNYPLSNQLFGHRCVDMMRDVEASPFPPEGGVLSVAGGVMSISSQGAGVACRPLVQRLRQILWGPVFAILLLAPALLALLALPLPAQAAAAPQHWTITDDSGQLWGLNLFEQPDPAYPAGWRLRLTGRSPGQTLDHRRPLLLSDGLGGAWSLPNRSEELVRLAEEQIPAASAQFDAQSLEPRPSEVLPLRLELPTDGRDGVALLVLQSEVVLALHELPPNPVT